MRVLKCDARFEGRHWSRGEREGLLSGDGDRGEQGTGKGAQVIAALPREGGERCREARGNAGEWLVTWGERGVAGEG